MKTVVSVTPLPVEADSRTFKQAASFAGFGYRSIVVEGARSEMPHEGLPFELRSVDPTPVPATAVGAHRGAASPGRSRLHPRSVALKLRVPATLRRWLRGPYSVAAWLVSEVRLQRRTWRRLPPADLYVLHGYSQLPAVWAAARRARCTYIYDAHDLYPALVAEQEGPALRAWVWNRADYLAGRLSAGNMTVAPGLARLQEQRFDRPFAVVRNAHDPRLDQPSSTTVRELSTATGESSLLVVVIGNAKPSMAIRELLAALAAVEEDVHFAGVGRGWERFRSEAERLGVDGRVTFTGPVPPAQVASFVGDADLGAQIYFPASVNSLNALPNGFFQAIAAGLPILYPSGLPEIAALAKEHRLGLAVDPRDSVAMTAALQRLARDRDQLHGYRENSRRARGGLTWEAEETALRAVVEGALGD